MVLQDCSRGRIVLLFLAVGLAHLLTVTALYRTTGGWAPAGLGNSPRDSNCL